MLTISAHGPLDGWSPSPVIWQSDGYMYRTVFLYFTTVRLMQGTSTVSDGPVMS
jgi:hypothetical protein